MMGLPSGTSTQLLNMAIEIVDLPTKNGDFPVRYVNVYQRVQFQNRDQHVFTSDVCAAIFKIFSVDISKPGTLPTGSCGIDVCFPVKSYLLLFHLLFQNEIMAQIKITNKLFVYHSLSLVGCFKHVLFSIIYGIILPIDFHIYQGG